MSSFYIVIIYEGAVYRGKGFFLEDDYFTVRVGALSTFRLSECDGPSSPSLFHFTIQRDFFMEFKSEFISSIVSDKLSFGEMKDVLLNFWR